MLYKETETGILVLGLIELLEIQLLAVLEQLDELVIFGLESLDLFIVLLFLLSQLVNRVLQILYFLRGACHVLILIHMVLQVLLGVLGNKASIVGNVAG